LSWLASFEPFLMWLGLAQLKKLKLACKLAQFMQSFTFKALHEPAQAEPKSGSARLEKNYANSSLMSQAKKNFGSTRSSRAKLGKIQARALHIPTKK
jgi:hypothetical protein